MKNMFAVIALFLVSTMAPCAGAVTLTFDELPTQPINGVSVMGVTFGYTGSGAFYNSGGPGSLVYVQDPSLQGATDGGLSFAFANPTNNLSFGIAFSTGDALIPAIFVSLYDPSHNLLAQMPFSTSPLVLFSEGLFSYSGGPVGSAMIDFSPSIQFTGLFALDNLTYNSTTVPEPSTLLLLGAGLGGLALIRRKAHK